MGCSAWQSGRAQARIRAQAGQEGKRGGSPAGTSIFRGVCFVFIPPGPTCPTIVPKISHVLHILLQPIINTITHSPTPYITMGGFHTKEVLSITILLMLMCYNVQGIEIGCVPCDNSVPHNTATRYGITTTSSTPTVGPHSRAVAARHQQ